MMPISAAGCHVRWDARNRCLPGLGSTDHDKAVTNGRTKLACAPQPTRASRRSTPRCS